MAPIQLPDIPVTSPAVGQIVPLDLSAVTSLLPFQPGTPPAYLRIYNETGCTFDYVSASGVKDTIPSGAWPLIPMTSKDTSVALKVKNIQAVAPISIVSATFYPPSEPIPQMPVLGNAPIGQSRVISIPTMPHVHIFIAGIALSTTQLPGSVSEFVATVGPGINVTLYVYSIALSMTGLRYGGLGLYVSPLNGGGVSLANTLFYTLPMFAGQVNAPLRQPIATGPYTMPASTVSLALSLAWQSGSTYPTPSSALLTGSILFDIDLTGQTPPPAIGNGAATPVGASY